MLRFLTAFLFMVIFSASLHAGTVDEVIAEVKKIQAESGVKTAIIGVCLIPIDAEPTAAAGYQIDTGMVPASTMKAITIATANEILGADFRFKTELQLAGTLDENGTLTGNVVILGGGDPTLGSSQISQTFVKWMAALVEAGVKKIDSSIVGDASIYGTKLLPDSWQWNDIGNYYWAEACGLTFHENRYFCSFRTGSVGSIASFIGTDPKLPEIEFINEIRVGSASSGIRDIFMELLTERYLTFAEPFLREVPPSQSKVRFPIPPTFVPGHFRNI